MLPSNSVPISEVSGVTFCNVYFDPDSNKFYTKRRGETGSYWPIMWKHVYREYKNKMGDTQKKLYRYINLYNKDTKERVRLNEDDWKTIWEEKYKSTPQV
jgi:hypothetical protein